MRAHGNQPYGQAPYVTHLAAVRGALAEFGHGGDLLVAAWLHDVLEDTLTPRAELAAAFGPSVEALVWAVTGVGEERAERNRSAYAKIRALPLAATLKLADRLANVRACLRDNPEKLAKYRAEMPGFEHALEGLGDPRLWAALRRALAGDETPTPGVGGSTSPPTGG